MALEGLERVAGVAARRRARFRALRPFAGQSVVEYAILVIVVITALGGMQTYVRRAIQGRMQNAAAAGGGLLQYEPTYASGDVGFRSRVKAEYAFAPGGAITGGSESTVWGPCEDLNAPDCFGRKNTQTIGAPP